MNSINQNMTHEESSQTKSCTLSGNAMQILMSIIRFVCLSLIMYSSFAYSHFAWHKIRSTLCVRGCSFQWNPRLIVVGARSFA